MRDVGHIFDLKLQTKVHLSLRWIGLLLGFRPSCLGGAAARFRGLLGGQFRPPSTGAVLLRPPLLFFDGVELPGDFLELTVGLGPAGLGGASGRFGTLLFA